MRIGTHLARGCGLDVHSIATVTDVAVVLEDTRDGGVLTVGMYREDAERLHMLLGEFLARPVLGEAA